MRIQLNEPGEPYETFLIYLDINDYVKLFSEETFGKQLLIVNELSKVLLKKSNQIPEWVKGKQYKELIATIKKLSEVLDE